MANPNGRLSRRLLEAMGLWNQALATGAVFVNPYDAANIADARRNLADSLSLEFTYTSRLGDLLEPAFASRTSCWKAFPNFSEGGHPETTIIRHQWVKLIYSSHHCWRA